jgi:hypothetical protein
MAISVAAFLVVLLPFLLGGRLRKLPSAPFRLVPWIVGALIAQVVIIELLPGPRLFLQIAHVATYVVAGAFVVVNRRIPGLPLIGAGAGVNGLVITLNGGTLPARAEALKAAGIHVGSNQFANSGVLSNPRLAFLGDVFAIPQGFPLAEVFSLGDILIVLGAGWTAWAIVGTRWTEPWTHHPRRGRRPKSGSDFAIFANPRRSLKGRADQSVERQRPQKPPSRLYSPSGRSPSTAPPCA